MANGQEVLMVFRMMKIDVHGKLVEVMFSTSAVEARPVLTVFSSSCSTSRAFFIFDSVSDTISFVGILNLRVQQIKVPTF